MKVRLLTEAQKDSLVNKYLAHSIKFNPIQDADGNWIISEEEVDSNIYTKYKFLEGCPEIEFKPRIEERPK